MTRPDAPPVSDDTKRQYLSGLLEHDPGVFLERVGDKLDAAELACFEPLRSDYEVDFYIRQLKPAPEEPAAQDAAAADGAGMHSKQAQRRLSAASKNRRLAQLQRLLDSGDYFSDDAMRARQPLLHHHYVAQYRPAASRAVGKSLAHNMLASYDEALIHSKLAAEREREDMIEDDSEDDTDAMPEDRRSEVQQPPPAAGAADAAAAEVHPVRLPAGTPLAANAALATAAAAATRQDAADRRRAATEAQHAQQSDAPAAVPALANGAADRAEQTQHGSTNRSAAAAKGGAKPAGGASDAGAHHAAEAGDDGEPGDDAEQEQYVHIPDDERKQLANDFLELMQAKFLGGEDADVDYASIDADATLDDDFSGVARQDAEDRYFAD